MAKESLYNKIIGSNRQSLRCKARYNEVIEFLWRAGNYLLNSAAYYAIKKSLYGCQPG
jgi:hypothetical protein